MYMLLRKTKGKEGAYAVFNKHREKVLFLFEDADDAERYAMMLHDQDAEHIETVQIDPELAIKTCVVNNIGYTIISSDDFVIPPVK
jgi:hypothetical protein